MANDGSASLTGSTGDSRAVLDGFIVNNLQLRLSRSAAKIVKLEVTGGALICDGAIGNAASVHGEVASDGSYWIGFNYDYFTLDAYVLAHVELRLVNDTNQLSKVTVIVTAGGLAYDDIVGTAANTYGEMASDGSYLITFNYDNILFGGFALSDVELRLSSDTNLATKMTVAAGAFVYDGAVATAADVSGAIASDGTYEIRFKYHDFSLDGYSLMNVELLLTCDTNMAAKVMVTAGALSGEDLSGSIQEVFGELASDGSYSIHFKYRDFTIRDYAFIDAELRLTSQSNEVAKLEMSAGNFLNLGLALTTQQVRGELAADGSGSLWFDFGASPLFGYGTSSLELALSLNADGQTVPTVRARLSIPGFNDALLAGAVSPDGVWDLAYQPETWTLFDRIWAGRPKLRFQRPSGASGTLRMTLPLIISVPPALPLFHMSMTDLALSGDVNVDGSFDLSASTETDVFVGVPVNDYSVRLTHAAGSNNTSLTVGFALALPGQRIDMGTHRFGGEINPDGSFTLSADRASLTLNQFDLSNVLLRMNGSLGQTSSITLSGDLAIPGLTSAASVHVSGYLNSDGTFRLTGSTTASLDFTDLSIGTIPVGATVELTQDGLKITAGLTGSLMTELNFSLPSLPIQITPSGSITNFSVSVTLDPLVFGDFRLESSSGGGFTATLDTTGLSIPSGAALKYKGRR